MTLDLELREQIRKELEAKQNNTYEEPSYDIEQNLGIIRDEEEFETTESGTLTDTQETERDENGEKVYKKLSVKDTWKDIGKTVGAEALRLFAPEQGSKAAQLLHWSEDNLYQHPAETKAAEAMKYTYRYVAGTLGFIGSLYTGGGLAANATKLPKAIQTIGQGVQKLSGMTKAAQATGKLARFKEAALGGILPSALADYNVSRPEEGEEPLIPFLQTKSTDADWQAKLKLCVDGMFMGATMGTAFEYIARPILTRTFKGLHTVAHAKTQKEINTALDDITKAQGELENVTETGSLLEEVKALKAQADETGEELSQLITDNISAKHQADARVMGRIVSEGDDVFPHSDGTFDIKVQTWEDAYKVSPEEFQKQLKAADDAILEETGSVRQGDSALNFQDEAVRATWVNRGWMGENDELNQKTVNDIVARYKDGWQIDNNIQVKFVDGLKPKGKAVDGYTEPVGKKILISIDKNTKNPYAVLRSELEHARDIAKGEVPNQKLQHFSRYQGKNEAEAALDYVYKKSTGRAEKIGTIQGDAFKNWYNDVNAQSTVGELVYHRAYKEKGLLDDVKDVIVRHDTTGGDLSGLPLAEQRILAGRTHLAEDGTPVIYTNTSLPPEIVEENIYHELQHVRQLKEAKAGNEEIAQQIEELRQLAAGNDFEAYKNHSLEIEADNSKEFLKYTKEKYNGNRFRQNQSGGPASNSRAQSADGVSLNGSLQDPSLDAARAGRKDSGRNGIQGSPEENIQHRPQPEPAAAAGNRAGSEPGGNQLGNSAGGPNPRIASETSVDDIVSGVVKGEVKADSIESIEEVLTKTIEIEPEISGTTFKDVLEDADSYYTKALAELNPDVRGIQEAVLNKDIATLDAITRKQLAVHKLIAKLKDNITPENAYETNQFMTSLAIYSKELNKRAGQFLNYQKTVNEAIKTFGNNSLSDLTYIGINSLADILDHKLQEIGLAFTRGKKLTLPAFKQKLFRELENEGYGEFLNEALESPSLWKTLNDEIDTAFSAKGKFDKNKFVYSLKKQLDPKDPEELTLFIKLCDNTETLIDTLSKAAPGKIQSYMINNILGPASALINITGGSLMSFHSANRRIIGGLLTGNSNITKSGFRQYQGLLATFADSYKAAKQAFLEGDGKLTTTKNYIDGAIQYNMSEFNPKSFNDWFTAIPRFMMASDEMISHLNYRSIMRSKAIEMVERQLGGSEVTDEVFNSMVKNKFKDIAFNDKGYPLDVHAFAEAKEILFQTPLNKKMWDYKNGVQVQVEDPSFISNAGMTVQNAAEACPGLKVFLPFIKTPFNIADRALSMNPIVQAADTKLWKKIMSKDPEIAAKARGEVAITLGITTAAYLMSLNGGITGSVPPDRKTASALMETGWQPYSFYIDGKFYSYKSLAPFDTILAASADTAAIYNGLTDADKETHMSFEEALNRAFSAFMNDYIDQTGFRGNMEKLLDLLDPSLDNNRKKQLAGQWLSGFMPLSSTARAVTTLGKHSQTKSETVWDSMLKPYNLTQTDFKRDVFGNRSDMYGLLITKMKDQDFEMPEYQAMAELAEQGWSPSEVSRYVADSKIPFTQFKNSEDGRSAYDYMQETLSAIDIGGLTIREAVRELVESPEYQALPMGLNKNGEDWNDKPTKINAIKAIFKEYNDAAKEEILNSDIEFINDKGETMQEAKERVDAEMEQTIMDALINIP